MSRNRWNRCFAIDAREGKFDVTKKRIFEHVFTSFQDRSCFCLPPVLWFRWSHFLAGLSDSESSLSNKAANGSSRVTWVISFPGPSRLGEPTLQWYGPIPKTLVIWASPSHIALAIWVRVRVTGDAHIATILGMRMPKMLGCPYHRAWNKQISTDWRIKNP